MKTTAILNILACAILAFGCSSSSINVQNDREPASIESCAELISSIINKNNIGKKQFDEVVELLKEFGVSATKAEEVKSYADAINIAYEKIAGTGVTSIKKSEKMVLFGKSIRELYMKSKLKPEAIRDLDYFLGRNVLKAEQFSGSEFKWVKENQFALGRNKNFLHINYKQYKEYTIAFEQNKPPYTKAIEDSTESVIDRVDIREIEVHNLFPVYFAHDMTHVRYALNHERYFPVLFGAARSKNHLRYVMMGALAEGVDKAQYSEEALLCRHFRDVKKLDLEEGLLWIARASNEDLLELAAEIGKKEAFEDLAKNFKEWVPKASKKYTTKGVSGLKLDEEGDQIFGEMRQHHSDPDLKNIYKNRISEILVSPYY